MDGEDTDVVVDLRHLNTGRRGEYDTFWKVRSQEHMYSLITHICTHPHIAIYIVHVHVHTSLIANLIYTCTHRNVKPFYMKTLALPSMMCGIVFMKSIAHSKSMTNIQKPLSSHTLLSRSSSSTAARLGTILSASKSVVCLLALFVDHPVFHQKRLTRYPSFPTPSLKQMATINLLKRCMVL